MEFVAKQDRQQMDELQAELVQLFTRGAEMRKELATILARENEIMQKCHELAQHGNGEAGK